MKEDSFEIEKDEHESESSNSDESFERIIDIEEEQRSEEAKKAGAFKGVDLSVLYRNIKD